MLEIAGIAKITESVDFTELVLDDDGFRVGEENTKFVEKDKPRPCSYNSKYYYDHDTDE